MDTNHARTLCLELMLAHGLFDIPNPVWRFEWMRSRTRLGLCNQTHRIIKLSKPFVSLNPESVVRDTILHEIAHALVGHAAGHGLLWKLKAQEIGAKPEACKDAQLTQGFVPVPGKYQATCGVCSRVIYRDRLPKPNRIHRCGFCYAVDREKSLLNYQEVR